MGSKYNHVCQALDVSNINSSASQGFCTQYNQCCYFYKFHGLLSHTDDSDCNLRNPNLKLPHFNLDLGRTSLRYRSLELHTNQSKTGSIHKLFQVCSKKQVPNSNVQQLINSKGSLHNLE